MKTPILLILLVSTLATFAKPPPHRTRDQSPSTNWVFRSICPNCLLVQTNHPTRVHCTGNSMAGADFLRWYTIDYVCAGCGNAYSWPHEHHSPKNRGAVLSMESAPAITNKPSRLLEAPKAKP